jgi:protein TonB
MVRPAVQIARRDDPGTAAASAAADVAVPAVPATSTIGGAKTGIAAAPVAAKAVFARPVGGGGGDLAAKPRYRTNPRPPYPIASERRGEEGIVLLNVAVNPNGLPAAISLNHSSGHPLLDQAAIDGVRRWTFEPARAGGVPVFSLAVVPVRFSLADRP